MGRFVPWRRRGSLRQKVTGIADGTDLETTQRYAGCGQVTRKVRIEDNCGRLHEFEVTIYGWKVLLLIDAATKIPLAVPGREGGKDRGA